MGCFPICCPGGLDGKKSACNVGDLGSIPGLGRYPGRGNSKPLQYSCLESPLDKGAWRATVHRVTESDTTTPFALNETGNVILTNKHIFERDTEWQAAGGGGDLSCAGTPCTWAKGPAREPKPFRRCALEPRPGDTRSSFLPG